MINRESKLYNTVQIQLLGKFQMSYRGITITASEISSRRLLKLISYLLYHHAKRMTAAELISMLWENEDLINHRGALKNLIYRLRGVLREYWDDTAFWMTDAEGYAWNTDIPIVLDTDDFESGEANRDEACLHALIETYHGKFMAECDDFYWGMCMQTYYQTRYVNAVNDCCTFLDAGHRYQEICEIVRRSMQSDILEETFHYWFIYALVKLKQYARAEQAFNEACAQIYADEHEMLSGRMRYLKSLINTKDQVEILDMNELIRDIFDAEPGVSFLSGKREALFTVISLSIVAKASHSGLFNRDRRHFDEAFDRLLADAVRMSDYVIKQPDGRYTIILVNCDEAGAEGFLTRLRSHVHRIDGFEKTCDLNARKRLVYASTPNARN